MTTATKNSSKTILKTKTNNGLHPSEVYSFTLTPSEADSLLARNTYGGQRPVSPVRQEEIEGWLDNNEFTVARIGICVGHFKGAPGVPVKLKDGTIVHESLVNGQTTCHAVKKKGIPVPAICEVYDVYNNEQLAAVYKSYDSPASVRTTAEVNKTIEAQFGVSWRPATRDLIIKALWWRENGFEKMVGSSVKKVSLFKRANVAFGNFLNDFLYGNRHPDVRVEMFKRTPVVAAMMTSFEAEPVDAAHFWTTVRDGNGLVTDSAEWCVRNFLSRLDDERNRRHKLSKHHGDEAARKDPNVGDTLVYGQLIRALNAYANNEPIKLKFRASDLRGEPVLNW